MYEYEVVWEDLKEDEKSRVIDLLLTRLNLKIVAINRDDLGYRRIELQQQKLLGESREVR